MDFLTIYVHTYICEYNHYKLTYSYNKPLSLDNTINRLYQQNELYKHIKRNTMPAHPPLLSRNRLKPIPRSMPRISKNTPIDELLL